MSLLIKLFAIVVISFAVAPVLWHPAAVTYHVDFTLGNDANSGTIGSPWKTISKVNSTALLSGDQVLFKAGEEWNGVTLIPKSGVTYGRYGTGNNPSISAMNRLTTWTNVGTNLWETTTAFTSLSTCWTVVMDGQFKRMGREPDFGEAGDYPGDFTGQKKTTGNAAGTITAASLPGNWAGGYVCAKVSPYYSDTVKITSHTSNTLTLWRNFRETMEINGGFFVYNHVSTLDTQGEWYFNPSTKKLRMYLTANPNSNYDIRAAVVEDAVQINNVSNVTIQNLALMGANRHVIDFQNTAGGTDNISIKYNNIYWGGSAGIGSNRGINGATNGSQIDNTLIEGNEFWQCMNWAVYSRGWGNNMDFVSNYVHNVAMFDGHNTWGQPQGAIVFATNRGLGHSWVGNRLDTIGYVGIKFGTENGSLVLNNTVLRYCLRLTDGGGIYGGYTESLTSMSSGRVLKNNIVLYGGSGAPASAGYSNAGNTTSGHAVAYYWDANATGITIDSCYGAYADYGMQWNSTQNVSMTNSVLFDFKSINLFQDFGATGRIMSGLNAQYNQFIARRRVDNVNQLTFNFDGNANGAPWNSVGTFDNNVHARPTTNPLNTSSGVATSGQLISVQETTVAAVRYTLNQFAASASYPYEHNGTNSPLHYPGANLDTLHKFYYNPGDDDTTIALDEEYIDMKNTVYRHTVTLKPHTAIFLLATNIPIPGGTNQAPTANAGSDQSATLPYPTTTTVTINPTADAYVRDGSSAALNFGTADPVNVKTSTASGFSRRSYFKFNVGALDDLDEAKLRIYGNNAEDLSLINVEAFTVTDDSWTEAGLTWNNQPTLPVDPVSSAQVSTTPAYVELDVSDFARQQFSGDGILSIAIVGDLATNRLASFVSRENASNKPQLFVTQVSVITLDGSNSGDPDGTITYSWVKQSGPAGGSIANANSAKATITDLTAGTYVYRLTVTDDDAATAFDDVNVVVSPAPIPNVAPTARAGTDQIITLPTSSVTVNATSPAPGSTDSDGTIANYQWSKVSPAGGTATITSPTSSTTTITGLTQGNYIFRLRVTDDDGAFHEDDMTVTVNAAPTPGNKKGWKNAGNLIYSNGTQIYTD
jgi:hypothetical protein